MWLSSCAAPSHQVQATRQGRATAPTPPQMVRSTEATEAQLNLAHKQGYAEERAEKWYLTHAAPAAHQQPAGEYRVAYTLSAPEGWYELAGQMLQWHPPAAGATAHLRVFVRDGADDRPLPGLTVRATFTPAGGASQPAQDIPAGWYPLVSAYGENVALPPGAYHLRLDISRLPFRRHDPYNGDRLTRPVVVEFDQVPLTATLAQQQPLSDAAAADTELAQAQGDAYHETLAALYEDANSGAARPAGDYRVGYALDYALATWELDEVRSRFAYEIDIEESAQYNAHVEATVQEARTGRFVPGLQLTATLTNQGGHGLGTHELPFEWHPWVFHYGANWRVPRPGYYRLRLQAAAPAIRRYGRTVGQVFAQGFEVSFDSVRVVTGSK
ncbi:MAG: iron transporter [Janthinobacterium lividum]